MAEQYNATLQDELWDAAKKKATDIDPQLALDIAGIFDPTPISDGLSVGMSLWKGDFIDAGLGLVSFIPYLGDAAAKPFKIARKYGKPATDLLDALNTLRKAKTGDMVNALKKVEPAAIHRAREKASKRVREIQRKKRAGCNTEACKKLRKSNMPKKNGKWDPADARETGNGKWKPEGPDGKPLTDMNGKPISVEYKDGYPDFKNYTHGEPLHIDDVSGVAATDANRLVKAYPEKFPFGPPDGHTLHHLEDGTVAFVDSSVHNNISHTGFASIQKTDLF